MVLPLLHCKSAQALNTALHQSEKMCFAISLFILYLNVMFIVIVTLYILSFVLCFMYVSYTPYATNVNFSY